MYFKIHLDRKKTDLNASYQKIHANAQIVSTCIVVVERISFLCLRLKFGTKTTPEEYTTIRESAIYLGNNLFMDT